MTVVLANYVTVILLYNIVWHFLMSSNSKTADCG